MQNHFQERPKEVLVVIDLVFVKNLAPIVLVEGHLACCRGEVIDTKIEQWISLKRKELGDEFVLRTHFVRWVCFTVADDIESLDFEVAEDIQEILDEFAAREVTSALDPWLAAQDSEITALKKALCGPQSEGSD